MNINRAGKQQKACWAAEQRMASALEREGMNNSEIQAAMRGHAWGWIAGVRWARRNSKGKAKR